MHSSHEKVLFEQVKQGNKTAFEQLFHRYYGYLCSFSLSILQDDIQAEEVVQDFFVKLWEKKETISLESSVKNYFFRSVKNRCLNIIKHNDIKRAHVKTILEQMEQEQNPESAFAEIDLAELIETSIAELPDKRREIFRLSREEGLKYREIAKRLNLSIKTVEAQMGLAIKTLREKLKRYNHLFLFFCAFFGKFG